MIQYPFDPNYILTKRRYLKRELLQQESLLEKKVAILSGTTIGELKSVLEIFLLSYGIRPVFFEGDYNRFYEDAVFCNGCRPQSYKNPIYSSQTIFTFIGLFVKNSAFSSITVLGC